MSNQAMQIQKKWVVRRALGFALFFTGILLIGFWCCWLFARWGELRPGAGYLQSPAIVPPKSAQVVSLSQSGADEQIYPVGRLFLTKEREDYQDDEMTLRIPKLGLQVPVGDSVSAAALKKGVGLYDYSPLPGKGNRNVSIAGHRDAYGSEFYYLDRLEMGDRIYLDYNGIQYAYTYYDTQIVPPDEWSAITCQQDNRLTLTSCDPIGAADKRIVVAAVYSSQRQLPDSGAGGTLSTSSRVGFLTTAYAAREQKTTVLTPKATGERVYTGAGAAIDASNASEGYVMVKYGGSGKKIKLQITCPNKLVYTYSLRPGGPFEAFPLTGGNGDYLVNVYENVKDSQYALALGQKVTVQLRDSTLPYLYPSQYVNFTASSAAVKKGEELAKGAPDDVAVVQSVYNFVIDSITYDQQKANTVQSGYLPQVDVTLSSKKGICFDYAALMATMLRTQNIPTRMEVGYVSGGIYHAWLSVHLDKQGWVNGMIQFDGKNWTLMDPTFASSGEGNSQITQFIGNGSNYQTKFVY